MQAALRRFMLRMPSSRSRRAALISQNMATSLSPNSPASPSLLDAAALPVGDLESDTSLRDCCPGGRCQRRPAAITKTGKLTEGVARVAANQQLRGHDQAQRFRVAEHVGDNLVPASNEADC